MEGSTTAHRRFRKDSASIGDCIHPLSQLFAIRPIDFYDENIVLTDISVSIGIFGII